MKHCSKTPKWIYIFCLLLILLLLLPISISATIITVDNRIPSIGQYSTILAAHNAAANGDTLYIYPSQVSYGNLALSKSIHLFGGGFDYNYQTSGIPITQLGTLTYNTGSENGSLSGFKAGSITISANHYSVSNCYLTGSIVIDASNTKIEKSKIGTIKVSPNHVSNLISSCYITGAGYYAEYVYAGIYVDANNEATIKNSIIDPRGAYSSGLQYWYSTCTVL